jgi:chorismate synthase
LIGLIESFPAGFPLSVEAIDRQLARRQQGYGRGPRMRLERDRAVILTGVRRARTLGSPITVMIENRDWRDDMTADPSPKPISRCLSKPRPGHADLTGAIKYDTHDITDVLERASARETAVRVACGAIARQLLEHFGIRIASHVIAIGSVAVGRKKFTFEQIIERADTSPVRCLDMDAAVRMMTEIRRAKKHEDTVGGVFEVRATGLPVGLGFNAQWFARLDSALAAAITSIPSVKGVEIGDGFAVARRRGTRAHDAIYYDPRHGSERTKGFYRRTNFAGGIEGGMTNGADIIIRAACKPIATLRRPLATVDLLTKAPNRANVTRADICVVPSAAVVGEAMTAMVLASAFTDLFGNDSLGQIQTNVTAYLKREY